MNADKDLVVSFHYTVSERGGERLESSRDGGSPLTVLIGRGGLIPGLEAALIGRAAGDQFEVEIEAKDAYGEIREGFTQRVAKKYFRDSAKLKPGMRTALHTNQGQRLVSVIKVGMTVIDVDLNHPMAGKDLHFAVEVIEVRAPSAEELAHGHAHGPGGHQH